jgi:hypothetical protein
MDKTQYLIAVFLTAFALLLCNVSDAETSADRERKDITHIAVGFGVQQVSYLAWRAVIPAKEHRWVVYLMSGLTTTIAAASWEAAAVNDPRNKPSGRDFAMSMTGGGLNMGVTLLFLDL